LHLAVSTLAARPQRPLGYPLDELAVLLDHDRVSRTDFAALWDLTEELRETLCSAGAPHVLVHGDPTAHNTLVAGEPPMPVGIIDFHLAHLGPAVLDIGFALWRSGRPSQDEESVDPARVRAFVAGYAAVRPLSDAEQSLIFAALWGRGVQMATKRALRGMSSGMERVRSIRQQTSALQDAIASGAQG
jgi:Ser/Thr protein kinase RdoA (MazF antagonist)